MKEFIDKLIGRLEEVSITIFDKDTEMESKVIFTNVAKNIVNKFAEEYRNDKVCQTAIMYAKNLHKYGVQIDSIWKTATQQSMALNQAYMRGRQDERDIFEEWQEKYINTSGDASITNADKIRGMTDEELAVFFEKLKTVCDICEFNAERYYVASENRKVGFLKWLQSESKGVTENE